MPGRFFVVGSLVLATLVACNKKSSSPPPEPAPVAKDSGGAGSAAIDAAEAMTAPADASATAAVEPAEPRARATLDAQLATFPDGDAALAATFTPKALVLTPFAMEAAPPENDLATLIPRMLGQKTLTARKANKLVAGSAPGMIWFAAELELDISGDGAAGKHKLRVLELLDGASGWKAAVATFGDTGNQLSAARSVSALPSTTPAGPLAKLLLSPGAAAAALANDPNVIVQGTEAKEYVVGPAAAKALLEQWSKLELSFDRDAVHEVRTKDWGFVVGHLNLPNKDGRNPLRMTGLLIAIPAGDAWSVVAVHYLPI